MSERRNSIAVVLTGAALLSIAAGSFKPFYLRMLTPERDQARIALSRVAFGKMPGYESFLEHVRSSTAPGTTIALAVPMNEWSGYSWALYRASYVLAGRTVLPLLDASNRPQPGNLDGAVYVAAWQVPPPDPAWRAVWQEGNGALLRRAR